MTFNFPSQVVCVNKLRTSLSVDYLEITLFEYLVGVYFRNSETYVIQFYVACIGYMVKYLKNQEIWMIYVNKILHYYEVQPSYYLT